MSRCPLLEIEAEWREPLAQAGLDTFDALMRFDGGQCVSRHADRQAYRLVLPGGAVLFLKRNVSTMCKHILGDVFRLRRPQPLTVKERLAIRRVAALGIDAPGLVAWGQRRRLGLAHQGVLLMTVLAGVSLAEYLSAPARGESRRRVMAAAGGTLARLYEAGLCWPDLRAKHVFVSAEGRIGLLDLERLHPSRDAGRCMDALVGRFCLELRECGATDEDLADLLAALGRDRSSVHLP